jgi:hypothetical protein
MGWLFARSLQAERWDGWNGWLRGLAAQRAEDGIQGRGQGLLFMRRGDHRSGEYPCTRADEATCMCRGGCDSIKARRGALNTELGVYSTRTR